MGNHRFEVVITHVGGILLHGRWRQAGITLTKGLQRPGQVFAKLTREPRRVLLWPGALRAWQCLHSVALRRPCSLAGAERSGSAGIFSTVRRNRADSIHPSSCAVRIPGVPTSVRRTA